MRRAKWVQPVTIPPPSAPRHLFDSLARKKRGFAGRLRHGLAARPEHLRTKFAISVLRPQIGFRPFSSAEQTG
jgi:hypothetical protein